MVCRAQSPNEKLWICFPQVIVIAAGIMQGRKLLGDFNSKAEVEDAYTSLGLNFFPIPGSEQELLSSRRSLAQFATTKWCIPG